MGMVDGVNGSALGDPSGYELAFLEGKAALAEQAATLKEVRDRVGTLVSTAAVVGGLATGLGLRSGGPDLSGVGIAGGIAAGLGFVGLIWMAVLIWRPTELGYALDAGVIVGSYVDQPGGASLGELHRELALHLGGHAEANRATLETKLTAYSRALVAFAIAVLGLGALVIDATLR